MSPLTTDERQVRIALMGDLRNWAKSRGLTQPQVAKELGIHRGYLSNLYRGKYTPNDEVFEKAGKLLNPPPLKPKPAATPPPNQSAEVKRALKPKASLPLKRKVAKLRTSPPSPEDLPFEVAPPKVPDVVKKLVRQRGRPRVEWTLVTFEEIDSFRVQRHVTKVAMAAFLGVAHTTYHNWQRGKGVPSEYTQRNIKRQLKEGIAPQPKWSPPASRHRSPTEIEINATCDVVLAMMKSSPEMTPDELVDVTKALIAGFTS